MKLGVMAALFGGMNLDSVLTYCAELGLDAIELPAGGYPGQPFFDPRKVLTSTKLQQEIKALSDRLILPFLRAESLKRLLNDLEAMRQRVTRKCR